MEALNLGKVRGTAIYTGGTITGTVVAGTIFSNSGITKAYQDDIYINTDASSESRGNVYVCLVGGAPEDAEWSYEGNIRGPQVELVNNLESLLTTKALSAYQGKVLRELILNAGAYAKEIPVYMEETVYSVKLVVENADTTITLTMGENTISKSYVKSGDSAERTLTIAAGENSGVLKRIESSGACVKSYVLYDSESKEIYSETLNIWDMIDFILQEIEPFGSIVDGAETIKTGLLSKFFGNVKKTLYPITHAKAAWFDKANNKTVYDAITEAKTEAENAAKSAVENSGKTLVSDEFLKTASYEKGSYCIYQNTLYKFTSDKTAGEWDDSVVSAVTVESELNAIKTSVEEVRASAQSGGTDVIGDAFSEELAYEAGDYCINNNTLYVFTDAKEAGAWDAGKVTSTTCADEFKALNSKMTWVELQNFNCTSSGNWITVGTFVEIIGKSMIIFADDVGDSQVIVYNLGDGSSCRGTFTWTSASSDATYDSTCDFRVNFNTGEIRYRQVAGSNVKRKTYTVAKYL